MGNTPSPTNADSSTETKTDRTGQKGPFIFKGVQKKLEGCPQFFLKKLGGSTFLTDPV